MNSHRIAILSVASLASLAALTGAYQFFGTPAASGKIASETRPPRSAASIPRSPPSQDSRLTNALIGSLSTRIEQMENAQRSANGESGSADSSGQPEDSASDIATTDEFVAAQLEATEQAVRNGTRDAWAQQQETKLLADYQATLLSHPEWGMTLGRVNCTSTLCRVALLSSGDGSIEERVKYAGSLPWEGERMVTASPGQPEVVIYAGRGDGSLPRVASLVDD